MDNTGNTVHVYKPLFGAGHRASSILVAKKKMYGTPQMRQEMFGQEICNRVSEAHIPQTSPVVFSTKCHDLSSNSSPFADRAASSFSKPSTWQYAGGWHDSVF